MSSLSLIPYIVWFWLKRLKRFYSSSINSLSSIRSGVFCLKVYMNFYAQCLELPSLQHLHLSQATAPVTHGKGMVVSASCLSRTKVWHGRRPEISVKVWAMGPHWHPCQTGQRTISSKKGCITFRVNLGTKESGLDCTRDLKVRKSAFLRQFWIS